MSWISNHKHKIEEKSTKSSRSSFKVVGLGPTDLWEFPTLAVISKVYWYDEYFQGNLSHVNATEPIQLVTGQPWIR